MSWRTEIEEFAQRLRRDIGKEPIRRLLRIKQAWFSGSWRGPKGWDLVLRRAAGEVASKDRSGRNRND